MELFGRFFRFSEYLIGQRRYQEQSPKKKVYLYDYGGPGFPSAKFENMVALELWRAAANLKDSIGQCQPLVVNITIVIGL